MPDLRNNLWIGSGSGGIYVFSRSERRWVDSLRHQRYNTNSLSSNAITDLYIDREGIIWANCHLLGLDQLIPDSFGVKRYGVNSSPLAKLSDQNVLAVTEDRKGNIWLGTIVGELTC